MITGTMYRADNGNVRFSQNGVDYLAGKLIAHLMTAIVTSVVNLTDRET